MVCVRNAQKWNVPKQEVICTLMGGSFKVLFIGEKILSILNWTLLFKNSMLCTEHSRACRTTNNSSTTLLSHLRKLQSSMWITGMLTLGKPPNISYMTVIVNIVATVWMENLIAGKPNSVKQSTHLTEQYHSVVKNLKCRLRVVSFNIVVDFHSAFSLTQGLY